MNLSRGVALAIVLCAGCGGSPYGHAPRYVPADREDAFVATAKPYDAAVAQHPGDASRRVVLFGVVDGRAAGPGGQALLKLRVRALEPANQCSRPGDDDSCRVTLSDKDFGVAWALVELRADDDVGPHAVGQRSLLRIVGTVGQDVSPADGAPVVHALWYRHWPSSEYVAR